MADRNKSVVDESDVKVTTIFSDLHDHAVIDDHATLDDRALAALGYKQASVSGYNPAMKYVLPCLTYHEIQADFNASVE